MVGFGALAAVALGLVVVARTLPQGSGDPATAMALPAVADAPGADVPGGDAPGGDALGGDVPGANAPGLDARGADAPGLDAPMPASSVSDGAAPGAEGFGEVGGSSSVAVPPGGVRATDWWDVLAVLDARRSQVLMAGDKRGMVGYTMPGSPAWLGDEAMLADLEARGVRPVGLASRILAIEAVSEVDVGVELQVVDLRSGYDLVAETTGESVGRVEPAGAARWTITLAPVEPVDAVGDPGWWVVSVEAT